MREYSLELLKLQFRRYFRSRGEGPERENTAWNCSNFNLGGISARRGGSGTKEYSLELLKLQFRRYFRSRGRVRNERIQPGIEKTPIQAVKLRHAEGLGRKEYSLKLLKLQLRR